MDSDHQLFSLFASPGNWFSLIGAQCGPALFCVAIEQLRDNIRSWPSRSGAHVPQSQGIDELLLLLNAASPILRPACKCREAPRCIGALTPASACCLTLKTVPSSRLLWLCVGLPFRQFSCSAGRNGCSSARCISCASGLVLVQRGLSFSKEFLIFHLLVYSPDVSTRLNRSQSTSYLC